MLQLKKPEELIEIMCEQGIKFDEMSKDKVKQFLSESTYYKKISSYKKNFLMYKKDDKQVYANLDFAYLKELSSIDADLRHIILGICLNIEHSIKVKILNKCVEMGFTGYDIADDFIAKYPKVKDNIISNMNNSYCEDLIQRNINHLPIWVIVEVVSFGDLCLLYKYMVDKDYFGDRKKAEIRDTVGILYTVHNLRNAAAHNHCLLRDLRYSDDVDVEHMISKYIADISDINAQQRKKALSTRFYHDMVSLLYAIDFFIQSESMKNRAKESLSAFMNVRAIKNKKYFEKSNSLKNAYAFFKKVIDFYF